MSMIAVRPGSINPTPVRRHPLPRPKPRPRPRPSTPRDSWPAWTDQRWTIEPEPRPTLLPEPPSPRAEVWNGAFSVGYEHVPAAPPAELPDSMTLTWWHGFNCGWLRRESDDVLIDRRQATGSAEPIREDEIYRPGATS